MTLFVYFLADPAVSEGNRVTKLYSMRK